LAGAERIKKAGVFGDSSFCETAFRLKNIVQAYENLSWLTKTKILKKKRPKAFTTTTIINPETILASIFYKNFSIFSKFLFKPPHFPHFYPLLP